MYWRYHNKNYNATCIHSCYSWPEQNARKERKFVSKNCIKILTNEKLLLVLLDKNYLNLLFLGNCLIKSTGAETTPKG